MQLFLDFETYYTREYSLSRLTPPEYILDKRFEVIGCAVRHGREGQDLWIEAQDLPAFFQSIDPQDTVTTTFNSLFDNAIASWIYGFTPKLMIDTMGMARAVCGYALSRHNLATVARHLELGEKGNEIVNAIGMRLSDIQANPDFYHRYVDYALNDNRLNAAIFEKLKPCFPASEMRVMDLVLRAAIEPQLVFDRKKLVLYRRALRKRKHALLRATARDRKDIMSSAKFTALLHELGVEVETKTSPTTGKQIPALAKTDKFMADLAEHPDERVAALASARLGLKSTIEETRAKRYSALAKLRAAHGYRAGSVPVALRYGAAHTHRLGGEWKLNFQNLPAGRGGQSSELRDCLVAPAGHVIFAPDYSQIEARMVAFLAGQEDLLKVFATPGGDPYRLMAHWIFGVPIDKIAKNSVERFIGKQAILGLGYGAGAEKFYNMVHLQARVQLGHDIEFSTHDAQRVCQLYRRRFWRIQQLWWTLDRVVKDMMGNPITAMWKKTIPQIEVYPEYIRLPSYLDLHYHKLRYDGIGQQPVYDFGRETRTIYGAKLLENISQALSRIITMNAAVRLYPQGYRMALQSHDELVFVVPENNIAQAKETLYKEMTRIPSWAKGLPLDVSIGEPGRSYGDAK